MPFDPNAPIPEADWSDPNSPLFNDPEFNHGNWRFNAATGQWEVGNTNMDVSNAVTNTIAPGAATPGIDANQPGASLNTALADADRTRLGGYLDQLTNQANTGGGAWEQALASNTHATQMNAEALGQTAGLDPMNAARNVGNAQAGAEQRSVGQGRLLRAQTQQQASGQLADVLGGQGAMDAQQAAQAAAARQARAQANASLDANARKGVNDFAQAEVQTVGTVAGASDGGVVPGQPKVMADSPVNDTVEAKSTEGSDLRLSPGEIIIPLSIAESPNAPQLAADFVAALKARKPQNQTAFDGGGAVPSFTDVDTPADTSTTVRTGIGDDKPRDLLTPSQYAPSIARGSLLDTKQYDATRDASLANSQHFLDAYAGKGPSVAPQAMQNATDSTLADAMRASSNSKQGPQDVTAAATEQSQSAAGNAAGIVAGESQRGGEAFAQALQRQRAQDLALATAQQQAAWRNTMMNAGVSLEQQNQIRNLLGSAGTGAVAFAGALPSDNSEPYHYDTGTGRYDTTPAYEDPGIASSPDEWAQPFAEGGVVAHLSRQGTRAKQSRPSDTRKPDSWGTTSKAGQGGPEEWADFPQKTRVGTQREADGSEQHFAGGGEVSAYERLRSLLAGASASPIQFDGGGMPLGAQPGPFAATQDGGSMPPRPAVAPVSRPQSLDDPNRPSTPPIPADTASRERPFIAKPPAPAAVTPFPKPAAPSPSGKLRDAAEVAPDQFALANQAGEQKAAAETQQADAQAAALMDGQKALEANAIDAKERAAKASQAAQQQLGVIQQAREEMKRIDTSVDPGKMWKDRSMVGKVFSIIGLVAGAIGNDNGVNRAASLLNQQIDRDIDAQKSAHELALRKGQSAVTSAENLYSISRQAAQDDIAAGLAAKGSALDLVANKVALAAAKAGSPMAKANLTALHAKVMADKDAADKAAHARLQDLNLKWYGAKTDRIAAERERNPAGAATQQALLATVQTEETTIKQQGEKLKALIQKYGTAELTGPAEAEMRQAVDNMAVAAAKMKDPNSAARPSEVEIESRNIFKPGFFKQKDTALQQIDSYLANSEQRRKNAFSARGAEVPGEKPAAGGASGPQVGEIRENSQTKKRIRWSGSEWVAL